MLSSNQLRVSSIATFTLLTCSLNPAPAEASSLNFGASRLESKTSSTDTKKPTLPNWKIKKILSDPSVEKMTENIFTYVDLTNKKVHILKRADQESPWELNHTFRCNPGYTRWDSSQKAKTSITPIGDYLVAEKGRFRRSSKYNNAPMPFYTRIWNPSIHASPHQSGYFFHVGKLNDRGSKGCIRLSEESAREIQKLLQRNNKIFVIHN